MMDTKGMEMFSLIFHPKKILPPPKKQPSKSPEKMTQINIGKNIIILWTNGSMAFGGSPASEVHHL